MFWLGLLVGWSFATSLSLLVIAFFTGASERMTREQWDLSSRSPPSPTGPKGVG